jgi:hypothetical protein
MVQIEQGPAYKQILMNQSKNKSLTEGPGYTEKSKSVYVYLCEPC